MFPLVKSWLESGQSKTGFCEAHRVNIHTFTYWLHRYREDEAKTEGPAFVRLDKPSPSNLERPYIIRYPNGMELQINTLLPVSELSKLIHLAQS